MLTSRQRLVLLGLFCLALASFFTGLNWGLPSRRADPFLFGNREPWTGRQVMDLAGAWDDADARPADVAAHPLLDRDKAIVVNATDSQRAEIVRRYRLYSAQPDEMITFRSLAGMHPGRGDLDPRLYQYGGLWIYPVGALLKLGQTVGLVTLRTDLAFYLDHSDAFARFYIVARGYSACWGLVGVWVVFGLTRAWTRSFIAAATAGGAFAVLPVVVNAAHEAKPHLAGAVLTLATIWAAKRYVDTGRRRTGVLAGALAGAAAGMVLTGCIAIVALPVSAAVRRRWTAFWFASAAALLVFVITNPYVALNLLLHRDLMRSNLGNTGQMYHAAATVAGVWTAVRLLSAGTSPVVLAGGVVAAVFFCAVAWRRRNGRALLLAAPVVCVLVPFVLFAAGKPAEYARFAIVADIALAIAAAAGVGRLRLSPRERAMLGALLVVVTAIFGSRYDLNFAADRTENGTRWTTARALAGRERPGQVLAILADPAPYCLPPVNLFQWQLVLLPRGQEALPGAVVVRPVDEPAGRQRVLPSPISWANKPFAVTGTALAEPGPQPSTRPRRRESE